MDVQPMTSSEAREAAMASGVVGAEEFGRLVDPRSMTHPTAGS